MPDPCLTPGLICPPTIDRLNAGAVSFTGFSCRSATTNGGDDANRGINAPATVMRLLRDQDIELAEIIQKATQHRGFGRGATIEGSRTFQRPVGMPTMPLRRGATVDPPTIDCPKAGAVSFTRPAGLLAERGRDFVLARETCVPARRAGRGRIALESEKVRSTSFVRGRTALR
ncbi:MAG: hypothetical protein HYV60_06625 [Planctomycetia bacterium]|nr:hypothetical protein [Planctomycetia bacterium]